MKKNLTWQLLSLVAVTLMIAGCARMGIYSDDKLTHETGIKFYTAKPYLLVAYTKAKDNPTNVSIVYLPDLKNPLYAKAHPGWGSANLSLALSNGMLTSFGQSTDAKIPETLTAVAGLANPITGLLGTLATAQSTVDAARYKAQSAEIYRDEATQLTLVAKQLTDLTNNQQYSKHINKSDQNNANKISEKLLDCAGKLNAIKTAQENLPKIVTTLKSVLDDWKQFPTADAAKDANDLTPFREFDVLKGVVSKVIDKLSPPEDKGDFLLYEIDNTVTPPVLRKVDVPR